MKKIEAISHIIAYTSNNLVEQVMGAVERMERQKLEVEIQYSSANEIYTALVLGRKVEIKNEQNKGSKTIRQTLQNPKA